nr:unnamed protein product [Spirometra erinaceieuropaei]
MPARPKRIPRTNRSRWTPSDPMRHQPNNVYLFSHSRPCRKPRSGHHPVTADHTVVAPLPLSTDICPAPNPALSAAAVSITTTTSCTPLDDKTTSDVPPPPTLPPPAIWTQFIPLPIAIALSPHASAWSVTCKSIARRLTASALTALTAPYVHSPHGLLRPYAHERKAVGDNRRLYYTSSANDRITQQ